MIAVPIDLKMNILADLPLVFICHGTDRLCMVQLAWVVAISSINILHAVRCLADGAMCSRSL